jgi:hypothetical protein
MSVQFRPRQSATVRKNRKSRSRTQRRQRSAPSTAFSSNKRYRKTPRFARGSNNEGIATSRTAAQFHGNSTAVVQPQVQSQPTIVYGKLYANWCGACTALKDTWTNVAAKTGSNAIEFSVEELEMAVKGPEFEKTYQTKLPEVQGYPTIYKLYRPGRMYTYEGERSEEKLLQWLNEPESTTASAKAFR